MAEQDIKTDVALIKKDVKTIEKYFNKFDHALETMAEMSQTIAVQGEVLKNLEERMEAHKEEDIRRAAVLTDRLEAYRVSSKEDHQRLSDQSAANRAERNKEIMDALSKLNGSLDSRIADQEKRIAQLEKWKYYIMGIGAVVLFIATKIQWPTLFG